MAFGLTCCDPVTITTATLPMDSDDLLERPEYWVGIKDVAAQPKVLDELSFWITEKGERTKLFGFLKVELQKFLSIFDINCFRRGIFCKE